MDNIFSHRNYTFKIIKSKDDNRPFRVRCLETSDEKDSACSYEDAANRIIEPLEFAKNTRRSNSQDIDYVKRIFEQTLIGKKKSECDDLVRENIFDRDLIEGTIYYFKDEERFAEYKKYQTNNFEIMVLFERSIRCGATKIVVSKIQ